MDERAHGFEKGFTQFYLALHIVRNKKDNRRVIALLPILENAVVEFAPIRSQQSRSNQFLRSYHQSIPFNLAFDGENRRNPVLPLRFIQYNRTEIRLVNEIDFGEQMCNLMPF